MKTFLRYIARLIAEELFKLHAEQEITYHEHEAQDARITRQVTLLRAANWNGRKS